MDNTNVAILVDAKEEYTKQLISILKTCIYQGIKSIYMDAKDICHQDNTPDNVLITFQDLLSRIPKWSQDIINKEFERISTTSKCDYIDDLLKVVYVSHIKVLTIVHRAQNNKKLSLKIPSGGHFIHLCYIECAREFWKDPYLLSDRGSKFEQQKNMRESETMIAECINETIRKQLPVRHILKEFLNDPDEDIKEESDDNDIKEPINKKYLKKLESIVKKDLKNTHTNENNDINIELIRKVIREEMQEQLLHTKTNTKIEKELVSHVVAKIVEQSNESSTEPNVENFENNNEINNRINNEDSIINVIEKNVKTIIKNKPIDTKPSVVEPIIITPDITIAKVKSNPVINEDNEITNTNLNTILDDNNNDNDNVNDNDNDNNNDNKHDTILVNSKPIESIESINTQTNSKIAINNIDEINLNLDELDIDSECEEIDINDLNKIQLNKPANKDTKFIFFNDAK